MSTFADIASHDSAGLEGVAAAGPPACAKTLHFQPFANAKAAADGPVARCSVIGASLRFTVSSGCSRSRTEVVFKMSQLADVGMRRHRAATLDEGCGISGPELCCGARVAGCWSRWRTGMRVGETDATHAMLVLRRSVRVGDACVLDGATRARVSADLCAKTCIGTAPPSHLRRRRV